MSKSTSLTRAALEQSVELVREASDWLGPLKSASGGLARILLVIRMAESNHAARDALIHRINGLVEELSNRNHLPPDIDRRVSALLSSIQSITEKVKPLERRKWFRHAIYAQRDAELLAGCSADLSAAILDAELSVVLGSAHDDVRRDIHSQSIADAVGRIESKLELISTSALRDSIGFEREMFKLSIGSHWVAFTQNGAGHCALRADSPRTFGLFA